jgi:hypothetical protein
MEGQGCPYLYKKKYPLAMESKDELRKRIEELEYGLAQAKWQSDLDRQISEENSRKKKTGTSIGLWRFLLCCHFFTSG